jgi:hypothetical protein
MTWHYRIMQDENGEWGVHEAYCDEGDELQPHSWTEEPVFAGGSEDVDAVRREIHRLAGDAYRPPLSKMWQDDMMDRLLDHTYSP